MNHWSGQGPLAPRRPEHVDAYVLSASAAKAITVPAGAKWVVFSAPLSMNFFVRYSNTPATIPGGDITDGSACEQNPIARLIEGVSNMSIISADAGVVTIAYYK